MSINTFFGWIVRKIFSALLGYTVGKTCASQRNLTWFTRPFLLVRSWDLGTRLMAGRETIWEWHTRNSWPDTTAWTVIGRGWLGKNNGTGVHWFPLLTTWYCMKGFIEWGETLIYPPPRILAAVPTCTNNCILHCLKLTCTLMWLQTQPQNISEGHIPTPPGDLCLNEAQPGHCLSNLQSCKKPWCVYSVSMCGRT